jgi:hypothetical protein
MDSRPTRVIAALEYNVHRDNHNQTDEIELAPEARATKCFGHLELAVLELALKD